MSARDQSLVICEDCGRGYPVDDLIWYPAWAVWLCRECALVRYGEVDDANGA